MGRLIVSVLSTLDGYAAGEGGNVFVMPIDLGFDRYNLERIRAAGTLVLGASSFRQALTYWPPLADDPDAPDVEREISRLYNTMNKLVISDSIDPREPGPWSESTEVVRRADAADRIAAIKSHGDADLICFGSLTTWNPLLAAGLVDELHVLIGPGAIGSGVPVFSRPVQRVLSLLDVRCLDDSQLVALRYAVDPA